MSYSTERIENILSSINSLDYKDDFNNIVEKVNELKSIITEENIAKNSLHSDITENFEKILNQISDLEKELSNVKTQEELITFKENLTEIVTQIQNNTTSLKYRFIILY